ncbi:undecaprenyl-diphosphate phosphatase [candidate division KSB1 bacterium]|nr:undecaprenyl-diphosphate phosphatase [candidate division KSB1 bacterium]
MEISDAILLGILQGLTEFLPISSSGHLVLGQYLLGIENQGILFEVIVHFGTLMAVLLAFRKDIYAMLASLRPLFGAGSLKKAGAAFNASENMRWTFYILLATLPAVVVGLWLEDRIEAAFASPYLVSFMLLGTAAILLATKFFKASGRPLQSRSALIIGLAQALAILPGISRSGSTISAGLWQHLSGNDAARFSFLLSIPAILGATLLKSVDLFQQHLEVSVLATLLVGFLFSFVSGYFGIILLLNIVKKGKLYWFAPYCVIIAILGLVFFSP